MLKRTLAKPVPVTVTVTAPEPADIEAGETLPIEGSGFNWPLTWKVNAMLAPPPGAGLLTDTGTDPGLSAIDGMTTVIDVEVVLAGENELLPKITLDVPLKLFPLRVNVTLEPIGAVVGEMLTSTGTAFCDWI